MKQNWYEFVAFCIRCLCLHICQQLSEGSSPWNRSEKGPGGPGRWQELGTGLRPGPFIADAMLVTRRLLVVRRSSRWPAVSRERPGRPQRKALAQHLLPVLCSAASASLPPPIDHPPSQHQQ